MKKIVVFLVLVVLFSCRKKEEEKDFQKRDPWKMVWSEEFNGDKLNSKYWSRISRGNADWCNYMSKADTCYEMRSGKLVLKGFKNTFLPSDTAKYLTGGVYTKHKKAFTYGKMSINAKLNGARGAWPAFWMLPEKGRWPKGGEIDIMEHLNYDAIAYQTVHSHYTYNLKIKKPINIGKNYINLEGFNTYSVEIYPDSLVFSINDRHTFTYPKINVSKDKMQFPFGKPFYLLLDMQLGGNWVGRIHNKDLPVEMEIDWVRFYERDSSSL